MAFRSKKAGTNVSGRFNLFSGREHPCYAVQWLAEFDSNAADSQEVRRTGQALVLTTRDDRLAATLRETIHDADRR